MPQKNCALASLVRSQRMAHYRERSSNKECAHANPIEASYAGRLFAHALLLTCS
jgi:hypothetical protein